MRRIFVTVFLAFLFGLFAFHVSDYLIFGAVITALFLIFFVKNRKSLFVFCIIFFLLGIIAGYFHQKIFEDKYEILSKMNTYEGYVIDKSGNMYKVKNYSKKYCVFMISNLNSSIKPGDYITFDGAVQVRNPGENIIMYSRGINAYVSAISRSVKAEYRKSVYMIPVIIRERINRALISIDNTGGAFVSGIVSGKTDDVDENDVKNFNDAGISHILAVSGFNLGIIYFFAAFALRKTPARTRYLIIIILCFFYTALSGFEASITRAFIMIIVVLATKIINRPYEVVNGITLTALIMLLVNSYYIYNIGFILSFAATYGIILLKDDIADKVPKKLAKFKDELGVTLSAFIATFPVIIWYKGTFSLLSILINIILGPVVAFITIISFIASPLYILTGSNLWFYPPVLLGKLFVKVIRLASQINFLIYTGRPSMLFVTGYYLLIFVSFGYIKLKVRPLISLFIKYTIGFLLVIMLIYHQKNLTIHAINVGQGDSILIETPKRHIILIDTGPEFADYAAVKEKVIPYMNLQGYGKIDLLILTHFHKDHAGGIDYLLNNCRIGKMISYSVPDERFKNFETVSGDDSIVIDDVIINVLYPKGIDPEVKEENETCLVLELIYKDFSMLLGADAEREVLECISGTYDIYKVAHHGSKYSLSMDMLDHSSIGSAVISVGKNSFGHPSPELLEEFKTRGIKVYRTDKDGNIKIITDGNTYSILSQLK